MGLISGIILSQPSILVFRNFYNNNYGYNNQSSKSWKSWKNNWILLIHLRNMSAKFVKDSRMIEVTKITMKALLHHQVCQESTSSKLKIISKEIELYGEIIRNGYSKTKKEKRDQKHDPGQRKSYRKTDRSRLMSFRHALPGLARTTSIRTRTEPVVKRFSSRYIIYVKNSVFSLNA